MDSRELAQKLVISVEGDIMSVCNVCDNQAHCDDDCLGGVIAWLDKDFR